MLCCWCSVSHQRWQFSWAGISTGSMLITSGPALAWASYDREQEGLPSLQTLIYKTCSFWNWLWPLPHLQWNSALHCMGFLISRCRSCCSLIGHVLFFCWDIKVCTVTLAQPWAPSAYTEAETLQTNQTLRDAASAWTRSCIKSDKLLSQCQNVWTFWFSILFPPTLILHGVLLVKVC